MSSWNNPVNIAPNSILSSSVWNNLLGTNTSLQYVYNNNTFFSKRFLSIPGVPTTGSGVFAWMYGSETSLNWFTSGYPLNTWTIELPEPGVYMLDLYFEYSLTTVAIELRVNGVYGVITKATELGVNTYKHFNFIFSTDSRDIPVPDLWERTLTFDIQNIPPTTFGNLSNISLTIAKMNGTI